MPITNLYFTNVGPFDEIEFDFDPQVNVFTGPNNSGKSSVLWVLGELLVFPFTLPTKLLRSDSPEWRLEISTAGDIRQLQGNLPADVDELVSTYEAIGYTCFVPAQRQSTNFRSSGPTVGQDIEARIDEELIRLARERPDTLTKIGPEQLRMAYRQGNIGRAPELSRRRKLILSDTTFVSDVAIIQKIIDLDYASYREGRPVMRSIVEKVSSLASEITEGFPIEFLGVGEDDNGLFPQFGTPDGIMPLNVLSQGTQSVIQCLARFLFGYAEYYDFPPDIEENPGIVIIDEIDAHLHPSWQRRVIPALTQHFPNLQIFCSTHSPLMLAGLTAGQVQLLRRDEHGVSVSTNESDAIGWTADEILRNLLEIPSPTDISTVEHIRRLQELRRKEELTAQEAENLEKLRQVVSGELLSGPMSSQVEQFAEELRRAREESSS